MGAPAARVCAELPSLRRHPTRGWLVRERGLEEVNANRNIEGRG